MIETALVRCRPTSADDSNDVVVALRPNNQNQTASNRSDRNEPIFVERMLVVKNLEVVDERTKQLRRFLETDAMLSLVGETFGVVPRDLHLQSVSQ